MIQILIRKDGIIVDQPCFLSEEAAQAWLQRLVQSKDHGEPAWTESVLSVPAIIDENGELLSPAQYENIQHPAEYEVLWQDITEQVEQKEAQEALNAAALKLLADTDWLIIRELDSGEACPAEIKAQRQAARESIVK